MHTFIFLILAVALLSPSFVVAQVPVSPALDIHPPVPPPTASPNKALPPTPLPNGLFPEQTAPPVSATGASTSLSVVSGVGRALPYILIALGVLVALGIGSFLISRRMVFSKE